MPSRITAPAGSVAASAAFALRRSCVVAGPGLREAIGVGAVGSGEAFIFTEAPQFTARSSPSVPAERLAGRPGESRPSPATLDKASLRATRTAHLSAAGGRQRPPSAA